MHTSRALAALGLAATGLTVAINTPRPRQTRRRRRRRW
jgi:hypothetical protein